MTKIACKDYDSSPARYAHVKHDGHYVRIVKTQSGRVQCFSSQDLPLNLPARLLANVSSNVAGGMTLLGELHIADCGDGKCCKSSQVKTAIIENDSRLQITYFAIADWPAEFTLECLDETFMKWGLPFADYFALWPGWSAQELLQLARQWGIEGFVLKDGNLLNWRKLKVVRTIDLICDGFVDGNGKYRGMIGAILCRTYEGHVLCSAGGMTDVERAKISADRFSYYGKVLEIEYQYVGAGGKLRHPRFVKWRSGNDSGNDSGGGIIADKLPYECGIWQDKELKEYYAS